MLTQGSDIQRASASVRPDRWMLRPIASTLTVVTVLLFAAGMPGALAILVVFVTTIACLALGLLLIGSACLFAFQCRLRSSISALLGLAAPVPLLFAIARLTDDLHLWLTLAFGIGYLGPAPIEGRPYAIYDWSSGFVGGADTFLIHDKTDAIALPLAEGAHPNWQDNDLMKQCAGQVRRVTGHYYVCVIR